MTEFYKAAFGIFAVLMAGASAWIGIDLIRASRRKEIGDEAAAVMGGLVFLMVAVLFGWVAWEFLK